MSILGEVDKVFLVLSGKGGVGKSTVAVQLALSMAQANHKVGLLDIDLCGPSVPRMLHLEGKDVQQSEKGWLPVRTEKEPSIHVMSIGFLLKDRNQAVVWRGPKKHAMINQFLNDVCWNQLNYLIVDTPPGTSDEHISIVEGLKKTRNPDGAILVTTPQAVALNDVRREITFCRKANIPIIGLIENMSGYVCPNCSECTNIFGSGGGQSLAEFAQIPFLGSIPIEPKIAEAADSGQDFVSTFQESEAAVIFKKIAEKIMSH